MHVPGSPLGEYRTRWKFTYSVHKECWLYVTCIFTITTSSKEKKTGFEQLLLPPGEGGGGGVRLVLHRTVFVKATLFFHCIFQQCCY